jgi:uncharacterized membrane protein
MSKKIHIVIITCLALMVVVLAAAVGTYIFGADSKTPLPAAEQDASPLLADAKTNDAEKQQQYEEFVQWLETESVKPDETPSTDTAQHNDSIPADQPTRQTAAETSGAPAQPGASQSLPTWQSIWADLNLTEAEQARLRQGFGFAVQRYMQMSPEQQAAERARMQSMRTSWEAMDDDEKAQASQRIRDRFEEWRQSGETELPELSLD